MTILYIGVWDIWFSYLEEQSSMCWVLGSSICWNILHSFLHLLTNQSGEGHIKEKVLGWGFSFLCGMNWVLLGLGKFRCEVLSLMVSDVVVTWCEYSAYVTSTFGLYIELLFPIFLLVACVMSSWLSSVFYCTTGCFSTYLILVFQALYF